jgi:glucose/arabinose dehydrogenase
MADRASLSSSLVPLIALMAALLIVAVSSADEGQPKASSPAPYECRWAEDPITVDGVADEADWKHAQAIDKFTLPWLQDKDRPAKTATRARLLWDREHLYFFAEMDDSDLYADVKEHDGQTWNNDVFELFFKPADDKPGYYEFQVNAAATKLDAFFPRRNAGGFERFKNDGNFEFETAVKLRGSLNKWRDKDEGWSVEGRFAWNDFLRTGGRPALDEIWKFAACRYDYSVEFEGPELSTVAPLKTKHHPDFHYFEDYAPLKFVRPPREASARPYGIKEKIPLTTSRVVGSPEPPLPYRVSRALPQLKLNFPIFATRQPGSDRLIVVAQAWSYGPAGVQRLRTGGDASEIEKLLEVPEGGVAYSVCFHPNFAENGYLYLGWNGSLKGSPKQSRVTRYAMDPKPPYKFDATSAKEIIAWDSDGHNGADMTFGADGMLYVTSGDGTSDSDVNRTGQDLTKLLAKVLRIDVDHPANGREYSVPADNPFVGRADVRPETWAVGLRNPWRITCDRESGQIWVGNNGQDLWEHVYLIQKGENYGWSTFEGGHPFYPDRKLAFEPVTKPAADHPHSEARSLTGGIVYRGKQFPDLVGHYLYGDYSTGKIWAINHENGQTIAPRLIADTTLAITSFLSDAEGEVLITDHKRDDGGFYRLERNDVEALRTASAMFPRTLSESGLFASVANHQVQPGVIPYSVNSPLWSDGALKERFIAIPHKEGNDMRIEFGTWRGWNFPDETVLIKSFALETVQGDPQSKRWIETRFLTKQNGEWEGYSYRWNNEQTDATLVAADGLNQEYQIQVAKTDEHPEGLKRLNWRYPSRSECMVCHSRAVNFVLGLNELQMNKEHDYGGVVDNQLRALEHLGMLRVNYHGEATAKIKESGEAEAKKSGLSEKKDLEKFASEFVEQRIATRDQREAKPTSLLTYAPDKYRKLPNPNDASQPLEARARSYLHANCSNCHVEAGGGNSQMDMEFTRPLAETKLIDALPMHHKFGLPDAKIVASGSPDRSVLLHRLSHRGSGTGQMPQLATSLVDSEAVKLIEDWIRDLKAPNNKTAAQTAK